MRFVLEQTPAESTAYRFAKLDLKYHSPESLRVVKGNISSGEIYYTNSTYLAVSSKTNPIDRVKKEGLFHPLIEAGRPDPHLARRVPAVKGVPGQFRHQGLQGHAERPDRLLSGVHHLQRLRPDQPRPLRDLRLGLRIDRCRGHHPHHRLLHQGVELEQGQDRRAERPLSQQRIFRETAKLEQYRIWNSESQELQEYKTGDIEESINQS